MKKLIILDRDGVINEDSDKYIKTPDEWVPIPGSLEAIAILKATGWTVAVATNQSGLARGLFDERALRGINVKMERALGKLGARLDLLVWCPHSDRDCCECRKPKPGLYKKISRFFGCALKDVPVVGDSRRDLQAAVEVGARPILVRTGKGENTLEAGLSGLGAIVYSNLNEAVLALVDAKPYGSLQSDELN